MPPNIKHNRNCTIYQRQQTGMTYDPKKGHDVPTYANVEIAATMDSTGYPPKNLDPPQVENATIQWYRGFSEINVNLEHKTILEATISGVKGRLHLEPTTQDSAIYKYKYNKLTGHPCQGWFQVGGRLTSELSLLGQG
jgi:hypothetical protein